MTEQYDEDDFIDILGDNDQIIVNNEEELYLEEHSEDENNMIEECAESEGENDVGVPTADPAVPLLDHSLVIIQNEDSSATQSYHCVECGVVFESIEDFLATHENNKVNEDMEINEDGVIPSSWQIIEDTNTTNSSDLVDNDEVENDDQNKTLQHQTKENEDESDKYICYDCHAVFEDLTIAEQHVCNKGNTTSSEKPTEKAKKIPKISYNSPVTCEICNTVLNNKMNLKFHMRIHDKRELKSIQDVLPAREHRQYNELNQFYCEICNKNFDQNLLTVHKKMHLNVEQYTCALCNRKFENQSNYDMHLKMHKIKKLSTNKADPPLISTFDTANATGKAPYPCQFCGREFGRPYEKVKHERIHTGEKPYECEVCGKSFRVSYSLTLHLRTHTNIRPYVCQICKKCFKSQQVYAHHQRIHSTERKYTCDICSKSFRTSVQLYSHKNSHTKPFNCSECNRPFASLFGVRAHMKTHNRNADDTSKPNENIHRCSFCGAEYARLFALRFHLRDTHGVVFDQQDTKTTANLDMKPLFENSDNFLETELSASEAMFIEEAAEANRAVSFLNSSEGISGGDNIDLKADNLPEDLLLNNEFCTDNYQTEEIISSW